MRHAGRAVAIPIKRELVRSLIKRRFGSVDGLAAEWEERLSRGTQAAGRARDRSTIYRWLERGLPSNKDDLFGFAAVLDVDPVALLDIDGGAIAERLPKERRWFQTGLAHLSALSPLWPIYTPGPHWPSTDIAQHYYGRPWRTEHFTHDATKHTNIYAAVHLTAEGDVEPYLPRTYHFAYRRLGATDQMWRPYGTVMGYDGDSQLISESGDYQVVADEQSPKTVVVETYFGPGAAEFRVASLNAFCIDVAVSSERITQCLRFGG